MQNDIGSEMIQHAHASIQIYHFGAVCVFVYVQKAIILDS